MKIQFLLVSLFLFIVTTSNSQSKDYVDAKISMVGGEVVEGLIKLPVMNHATRIVFKKNDKAKKETIKVDEIDFFVLKTKKDRNELFIQRSHYYKIKGDKVSKDQAFFELRMDCQNFKTYLGIAGFDVARDGKLIELYNDGMGGYYIQSKEEDFPSQVGFVFLKRVITEKMFDKQRKTFLDKYYADDPEGLKFLESKDRVSQEELQDYLKSRCDQ